MALVAFGTPRFARGLGDRPQLAPMYVTSSGERIEGLVTDQVEYLKLVDWAGGRRLAPDTAPFNQRLLVPYVASLLPLDEPVALNLVNLLAMAVGLVSLVLLTARWVQRRAAVVLIAVLYGAGFPVLWYSTSNWIDAGAVGLVGLIVLAAYRRWWAALLLVVPAVLAKESALVVLPFGMALEWYRPTIEAVRVPKWIRLLMWPLVGAVAMLSTRLLGPEGLVTAPWRPNDLAGVQHWLQSNLDGPRNLVHVTLTAAVPLLGVVFTWLAVRKGRLEIPRERLVPLTVGCLGVLGLSFLTLFGALWDGRTVWMLVPFGLPLLAVWLDEIGLPALTRPDSSTDTAPRRSRAALVQLGCIALAAVLPLPFLASELTSTAPAEVRSENCRFADRLAQLDQGPRLERTGVGDESIELPEPVDAPQVVTLSSDGGGPIELRAVDAAGATLDVLIDVDGPYHGSVLLDTVRPAASLALATSGEWSLSVRPVSQLFDWEAVGPLNGSGDAVLVIPGGSRVRATATLRSPDPDAGLIAVGREPSAGATPEPELLIPVGTEALRIHGTSWELSTIPEGPTSAVGC